MMKIRLRQTWVVCATLTLVGCGDDSDSNGGTENTMSQPGSTSGSDSDSDSDGEGQTGVDSDDSTTSTSTSEQTSTTSTTIPDPTDPTGDTETPDCTDQLILDLQLVQGTVSTGEVGNTADGNGWVSTVDATAGGLPNAPMNPWVYLQFTETGLQRVEIDDLQALESTDWDIAAKRFGVRLNSGTSGPGGVRAAAVFDGDYDQIDELPPNLLLLEDVFYSSACQLLDDGSGLGAPGYVMTPWWEYPGCVATTDIPFVIELEDGTQYKFVVDAYYGSGQDDCNSTGAMGSGSANFTWRWSALP